MYFACKNWRSIEFSTNIKFYIKQKSSWKKSNSSYFNEKFFYSVKRQFYESLMYLLPFLKTINLKSENSFSSIYPKSKLYENFWFSLIYKRHIITKQIIITLLLLSINLCKFSLKNYNIILIKH